MRVFERAGERWEIDVADARIVARRFERAVLVEDATTAHGSALRAKWEADRFCTRLAAQGFARVAGGAAPLGQTELEAALRANPDDADVYLVYADWLSDRGDDWGQLIAIQHALATLPRVGAAGRHDELSREETLLRFRLAGRLWGTLGETVYDESTQRYWCDLIDATWERGFLRGVQIRRLEADAFLRVVAGLHGLPIAAVLREIVLFDEAWPNASIDAFAARRWSALRRLEIGGRFDLQRLLPVLATSPLDTLVLESVELTTADIDALARMKLHELRITGSMPDDARARLPDAAEIVTVIPVTSVTWTDDD